MARNPGNASKASIFFGKVLVANLAKHLKMNELCQVCDEKGWQDMKFSFCQKTLTEILHMVVRGVCRPGY